MLLRVLTCRHKRAISPSGEIMKIHIAFILAAALALSLIDHGPANAQQSSDQRKCINALNKRFLKIAVAQGKGICRSGFRVLISCRRT